VHLNNLKALPQCVNWGEGNIDPILAELDKQLDVMRDYWSSHIEVK
jgi:hypothetical protein